MGTIISRPVKDSYEMVEMLGKMLFITFITLSVVTFIGCENTSNPGSYTPGGYNPGGYNPEDSLSFNISDADSLFISSQQILRSVMDDNVLLYKKTKDGKIQSAVSGVNRQFIISKMFKNPVTDELFLTGFLSGYNMIRIDNDDKHFGLRADDYHYYRRSDFDKNGVFYFVTSSASPGKTPKLWKYENSVATPLIENSNGFIMLRKVFANGYLLYTLDSLGYFLRAPDGSLKELDSNYSNDGVYSIYNNVWYCGNKAYDFNTNTEFDISCDPVGYGRDIDSDGPYFYTYQRGNITRFDIQDDKTLSSTIILSDCEIGWKKVDEWEDELFISRLDNIIYFAGKYKGKSNFYKIIGDAEPIPLLKGSDDDNYLINSCTFENQSGKVLASVQQKSTGKYGRIEGNFSDMVSKFTEDINFKYVKDVLIK